MNYLISIFIGLLFGCNGIFYKIGSTGKVYPIQGAAILSVLGLPLFALLGRHEWSNFSWRVLVAGLVFGVTQYLGVRLLRAALKHGPLSPAWCAQSLNFVPVILYSAFFLGERLSFFQYGSLLATIGAIIAAACGANGGTKTKATSPSQIVAYGLILLALLVSMSVLTVGLKFCTVYCEPGQDKTMIEATGNIILSLTYLFIGLSCAIDLTIERHWIFNREAVISGAGIMICTTSGYLLTLLFISKIPAIVLFAASNAASILLASWASVLYFKEKKTLAWGLTVAFATLAILLNR